MSLFVWQRANPRSEKLTLKDKRGIASRITALVAQLPKIKDALVMRETWAEIAALCDKLDRPYPDLSLLGKGIHSIELEAMDRGALLSHQPAA